MTISIRNIFDQNILLLKELDRANFYFRNQQYDNALHIVATSVGQIKSAVDAIIRDRDYFHLVTTDIVLDMLTGILNAQKKRNYVLLADLLELQLISFLCGVQELIISREEIVFDEGKYINNVRRMGETWTGFPEDGLEDINPGVLLEGGYRVEFTSTGLMTLSAQNGGSEFYMHTNSRIYSEALQLAGYWYQRNINTYILYGFGMGYHAEVLLDLAPEAVLEVYEADLNVLKLSCAFRDVTGLLENSRLKLYYDPEHTKLKQRLQGLSEAEKFLIHYPSFQNIRNQAGREIMESFIPWSKTLETG